MKNAILILMIVLTLSIRLNALSDEISYIFPDKIWFTSTSIYILQEIDAIIIIGKQNAISTVSELYSFVYYLNGTQIVQSFMMSIPRGQSNYQSWQYLLIDQGPFYIVSYDSFSLIQKYRSDLVYDSYFSIGYKMEAFTYVSTETGITLALAQIYDDGVSKFRQIVEYNYPSMTQKSTFITSQLLQIVNLKYTAKGKFLCSLSKNKSTQLWCVTCFQTISQVECTAVNLIYQVSIWASLIESQIYLIPKYINSKQMLVIELSSVTNETNSTVIDTSQIPVLNIIKTIVCKNSNYLVILSAQSTLSETGKITVMKFQSYKLKIIHQTEVILQFFKNNIKCDNKRIVGTNSNSVIIVTLYERKIQIILVPIFIALFLIIVTVVIFLKIKFIILILFKIFIRSWKYFYYLLAFIFSLINLKILMISIQNQPKNVQIEGFSVFLFIQYFIFIFIITIYQCYQNFKHQNKRLILHTSQGMSVFSYLTARLYFTVILIFFAAFINTSCIALINPITVKNLNNFIISSIAFITCTLSNISFCLLITQFFKRFNVVVQILLIHHVLSFNFLQAIKIADYHNFVLLQFCQYYNGIYSYNQIIRAQLNPFAQMLYIQNVQNVSIGLIYSTLQFVAYTSLQFLIVFIKFKKASTKTKLLSDHQTSLTMIAGQLYRQNNINSSEICKIMMATKIIKNKTIFQDVSFSINQQQIFVLLGLNQSGKTSMLNTILRMQSFDKGQLYIKQDVKIGCCLQSNIYHNQLTFLEHIEYFGQLKNIPSKNIQLVIDSMVNLFHFETQKQKRAGYLSGGNLKKLCLACAFVGQINVLILDQPDYGLDANFRKLFWKLLKIKKEQGTTVIVATSDQEQAQILADRICDLDQNCAIKQFGVNCDCQMSLTIQQTLLKEKEQYLIQLKRKFQANIRRDQNDIHLVLQLKINDLICGDITDLLQIKQSNCEIRINKKRFNNFQSQIAQICAIQRQGSNKYLILYQIKGVAKKRLQYFRFYLLINMVILFIESVICTFKNATTKFDQNVTTVVINFAFFIYLQIIIIRNQQMFKNRYKNALFFGLSKIVYWSIFMVIDSIMLFLLYILNNSLSMLYYKILNQFDNYYAIFFCLNFNADFLPFSFMIVFIFLYVILIYILSSTIKNYLLFIFIFFFLNGFSFFSASLFKYNFGQKILVVKDYYFSQTLYALAKDVSDHSNIQTLILSIVLQTVFYLIIFILILYIQNYYIRWQPTLYVDDLMTQNSRDQNIQEIDIQNQQNKHQIPLIIQRIYKSYNSQQYILQNVSFMLRQGQIFGLIGANGSGKSTIFNIITGFIGCDYGSAKYFGKKLHDLSFHDHQMIGYCPQFDFLDEVLTVKDNIKYFGSIKGMNNQQIQLFSTKYLTLFDMLDQSKKKVINISGGDRRKVCSILTFIGNPKILLFDEPSTGMDLVCRHKLWQLIRMYCKQKQASVLLTTHNIAEAEKYCDRIGLLKKGHLIAIDTPKNLVAKYSNNYRLILKARRQLDIAKIRINIKNQIDICKEIIDQNERKLIFDYAIKRTDSQQLIERIIERVLRPNLIDYFQFYRHTLQNVIVHLLNQKMNQSDQLLL